MTPDEARDRFSSAYDGELSPEAQRAFDEVVAEDAALAREWDEFRALLRATHADADDVPEVDLLAGVQRKIRQRSRGRYYRDRFSTAAGLGVMPLVLGLVVLTLIGVAWFAVHHLQVDAGPHDVGPTGTGSTGTGPTGTGPTGTGSTGTGATGTGSTGTGPDDVRAFPSAPAR